MYDPIDPTIVTILDFKSLIECRIREITQENQQLVNRLDRRLAGDKNVHDGIVLEQIGSNARHLEAWVSAYQLWQELPIKQPIANDEDRPF
jgi:hypothetical protein